jgi:transposase
VFRGYGIEVELVPEYYTSKERSICCEVHEKREFTEDYTSAIRLGER